MSLNYHAEWHSTVFVTVSKLSQCWIKDFANLLCNSILGQVNKADDITLEGYSATLNIIDTLS